MLAADGLDSTFGDGITVVAGGNGIALGALCALVVIRDAERRADPTEEYDRIAVASLPRSCSCSCPGRGLRPRSWAGGRRPGRRGLRPGGGARRAHHGRAMSKFTALTDELHDYMVAHGARQDEVLRRVQEETAAMGDISVMQIAPDQGAFMTLLCRLIGAREAIELGTFTGYSAICIARGLEPGGRLIACELSEEYAEIAARNFEAAGVADRIEIRIGPALDTLADAARARAVRLRLHRRRQGGYPAYYEQVLARTSPGGLIVVDNVLAAGRCVDGRRRPRAGRGDPRASTS